MIARKGVNAEWLKQNVPCMFACPVETEAGRYVNLIARGQWKEAYELARRPNPFASICGRICSAPCEDVCRRRKLDGALSIRALKRFVCERYGVEGLIDTSRILDIIGPRIVQKDKKVAIIGSGPAGMAAAHDLALMGYRVTVFEAQDVAGGMLRLGVPEYRLPRELIRIEISAILSLGIELKTNHSLGEHFGIRDLKDQGFAAVFIAIGARRGRDLRIEGITYDGVFNGVDFLLNANLGYKMDLGDRILVIGGGNVAFDVARTAARQTPVEHATSITEALDVARSAVRFGVRKVDLVCLESREDIPALDDEIRQAVEERIRIHPGWGPKRILGENGKVSGVEAMKCVSVFDDQGRFNPEFDSSQTRLWEVDSVIIAIGQTPDLSCLDSADGIEVTPEGTIKVFPNTLQTTAPGIFAGGDVAFGPRIAIDAVADGRRAAAAIDRQLSGEAQPREKKIKIRVLDPFAYHQYDGFDKIPPVSVPELGIDRRVGVAQVEVGYDEIQAAREAQRCFRCWINTVFEGSAVEGSECILCGGCVDVCPESCIEIVHFDRLKFDDEMWEFFRSSEAEFIQGERAEESGGYGAVMIKDETACTRCGLCAKRCPTGCIRMEESIILEAEENG